MKEPLLEDLKQSMKIHGYPICGDFELLTDAAFLDMLEEEYGSDFIPFGNDSEGTIYAIWAKHPRLRPIVTFGSSGMNQVMGNDFHHFLSNLLLQNADAPAWFRSFVGVPQLRAVDEVVQSDFLYEVFSSIELDLHKRSFNLMTAQERIEVRLQKSKKVTTEIQILDDSDVNIPYLPQPIYSGRIDITDEVLVVENVDFEFQNGSYDVRIYEFEERHRFLYHVYVVNLTENRSSF